MNGATDPFFNLGVLLAEKTEQITKLKNALDHALNNMSKDQHATMTDPTYEQAMGLLR
jgi:hypothetical protein